MVSLFELALSFIFIALTVGGTLGVIAALGWLSPETKARDTAAGQMRQREQSVKEVSTPNPALPPVPSHTSAPVFSRAETLRETVSALKNTKPLSRDERIKEIPVVSSHIRQAGIAMLRRKVAVMDQVNIGVDTFHSGN